MRNRRPPREQHPVREDRRTPRLLSVPMARRRALESQPSAYLAPGETWPEGELVDDAPDAARFAKKLAQRLKAGCGGDNTPSINAIAKRAGVNPQTVANLLNGKTWGELPTIFRIEAAIEYELWTHDHLPPVEDRPHIDGLNT